MPIKINNTCETCLESYYGYGKQFCSYACRAEKQHIEGTILSNCITCKKPFRYKKKRLKEGNPKFCSSKCVRHSEKTKQKIRDAIIKLGIMPITPTGKNHHNWKGDDVGYVGVHHWLRSKYGYANKCETCGKLGEKVNGIWNIQWANKTGKYLRKRNDFQGLCVSCHKKYDLNRLSN